MPTSPEASPPSGGGKYRLDGPAAVILGRNDFVSRSECSHGLPPPIFARIIAGWGGGECAAHRACDVLIRRGGASALSAMSTIRGDQRPSMYNSTYNY